ncbi:hypothetical protein [Yonghaparkia sp. Root332]|uniref:hypothetical protein n=1 Tax=Yonghaparkia sp. Root332 TaxID=1736516 RepID=UPI0007020C17|nr:hypothetical protein [Yonghaparkia sp. Root332]KQV26554.1 hypothetical protein ASC54_06735 [Yonghaparkia sp. Root332]
MIARNPYLTALGTIALSLLVLGLLALAFSAPEFASGCLTIGTAAGLLWLTVGAIAWHLERSRDSEPAPALDPASELASSDSTAA